MAVKKLRPITPSQRHTIVDSYDDITASRPEESLVVPIKKSGGRNNDGKMTMRYVGGGHKRMYRIIDFKRNKHGIEGIVKTVEYDPNRTARIALVYYKDGEKRYIIAPNGIKVGQKNYVRRNSNTGDRKCFIPKRYSTGNVDPRN